MNETTSGTSSVEQTMESTSDGTLSDKFQDKFTKRLQKLLLGGAKPLKDTPDPDSIERFGATSVRRGGKQFYEFRPDDNTKGVVLSGQAFDPKGLILLVKDRISREHWVNENVIKYHNNSWSEIQELVFDCIAEEDFRIFEYLLYLQRNQYGSAQA